jgi:hypothetical protein
MKVDRILSARPEKLAEAVKGSGMFPELRAMRLNDRSIKMAATVSCASICKRFVHEAARARSFVSRPRPANVFGRRLGTLRKARLFRLQEDAVRLRAGRRS